MRLLIIVVALIFSFRVPAAEGDSLTDLSPASTKTAPSSGVGAAMKRISAAPGFKIEPFATEPDIQNVVSFCFDEKGNAYVVETHRRRTSVFDIRWLTPWLDEDFALRTPEDRAKFLQRHLDGSDPDFLVAAGQNPKHGGLQDFNHDGLTNWHDLEVESERIRFLKIHDGKIVNATTFADGFNSIVSGVAAGVLARGDQVWFTCIPDLWVFTNSIVARTPNAASAGHEHGKKLISGFGVHVALGGHDMHGLKLGPDGKLYWSIADRGTSTNLFSKLTRPFPGLTPELLANAGAVFRANPDGSEFEVFATGLRNPQELAFDDFGNLFTGDNNADGGDKARWEHVVEGADYGWRIGYQWLPKLGAWNTEMLWGLAPSNSAAYLLPPVVHISHGPAGTAHYPGTGMPAAFADSFFLADFPGGVRHFKMKPKGASFTAENPEEYMLNNSPEKPQGKLLWNVYPTDVDFGLEGGLYVSDWVEGWEKTGKGRIWRVYEPESVKQPIVAETKKLLADGMAKRPENELVRLLGHADQRVRLAAQFELAGRDNADVVIQAARSGAGLLGRIHSIWALGQLRNRFQKNPDQFKPIVETLVSLLKDSESEIRAQSLKVLDDAGWTDTVTAESLLSDSSPRVKFFAASVLGRAGDVRVIPSLLKMLRENHNQDPYLIHAAVLALARLNDLKSLMQAGKDASPEIRLGACLALRRLHRPEIAIFLKDADPQIVLEAARAIYEENIVEAMPALAAEALSPLPAQSDESKDSLRLRGFARRRALHANFRLGTAENAEVLAELAARNDTTENLRLEALDDLALWGQPPGRDPVIGLWRPLPIRESATAAAALRKRLPAFAAGSVAVSISDTLRIAVIRAATKMSITEAGDFSLAVMKSATSSGPLRVEALRSLAALKDARLGEAVQLALQDKNAAVRAEGASLQTKLKPENALEQIAKTLESASLPEQQSALKTLGSIEGADRIIAAWLDRLLAGKLPAGLQLDLLEAAAKSPSPEIKTRLEKFDRNRSAADPLARFRECVAGGDARLGRQLFYERQEASCFRCHKINGEGGDVGPDLTGIGTRKPREYLLESMVNPNAQIAQGFESALVTLKSGIAYAGVLKSEDANEMVLNSPEDGILKLKKSDIAKRERGLSPMPEGLGEVLSRRDLRDLVEFLAQSK